MATLHIETITFLQDNSWGTFVAGDYIDVYFDTSTYAFSNELNGSPLASSPEVLVTLEGDDDLQRLAERTRTLHIANYCDSTTQLIFNNTTSGGTWVQPYVTLATVPNSTFCAASPVVCDIVFSGTPTITNATTSTSYDGAVTFNATTSNSPIQYRLNQEFNYNDGTGQGTSTFTGLGPGNYVLYARDSKNCPAYYIFTILDLSALIPQPPTTPDVRTDVRWKIRYYDIGNNQQAGIDIIKSGYSGSAEEVDFDDNPATLSYRLEGNDDKFTAIMPSEMVIRPMSNTHMKYAEIFEADINVYRVHYFKDTGAGLTLRWAGRLVPNVYQETYAMATPYPVEMTATDGLAELEETQFLDTAGTRFRGTEKSIVVIAKILQKTGLQLSIRSCLNIYAVSDIFSSPAMNTTASDDPLAQAYVDYDSYYQEADALSCGEVLRRILNPWGARICQWGGYWYITCPEEYFANYDYRQFDYTGTYSSNGTVSNVVVSAKRFANQNNRVTFQEGGTIAALPSYKEARIVYDQGYRTNVLRHGDFSVELREDPLAGGQIRPFIDTAGWVLIYNGDTGASVGLSTIDETNVALALKGTGDAYILFEETSFSMATNDKIKISLKYRTPAHQWRWRYQKLHMRVTYGSKWLKSDGTWATSLNDIYLYESEFGVYKTFELTAGPPADGITTGSIMVYAFSSYVLDAEYTTFTGGASNALDSKVSTALPYGTKSEVYNGGYMYYYELESGTSAESSPDIIRPDDYAGGSNEVIWVLKERIDTSGAHGVPTPDNTLYIDRVGVEYLPGGNSLPAEENIVRPIGDSSERFEKTIYHGSLNRTQSIALRLGLNLTTGLYDGIAEPVGNQNPQKTYFNFLRNSSGTGYTTFKRDSISESAPLQKILAQRYATQYRRPIRKLSMTLTNQRSGGANDVAHLGPICALLDTYDTRYYLPMALSLDDRHNSISGEFIELINPSATAEDSSGGGGSPFTSGFSTGYGSGYN